MPAQRWHKAQRGVLLAKSWQEPLHSEERGLRKGCEDQEAAQLDRTSTAVMERGRSKKRHSIRNRAEAERAKIQCAVGGEGDRFVTEVRTTLG